MNAIKIGNLELSGLNQILVALLVIQVIIAGIVFWPSGSAADQGGLMLDLTIDEITKLTIINESGNDIVLDKDDDGWILANTDSFPALENKVTDVLTQVVNIQTNRLVAQTDTSHRRLQVAEEEFARQVIVETDAGVAHTLYIGSSPNVNATHVRLDGQDETYLARGLNTWQINPAASNWIEALYFSVATADITAMTLKNAQGEFQFQKEGEDTWTMLGLRAEEEVIANNITSLASQISALRMSQPLGQSVKDWFELDAPLAEVMVTTNKEGEDSQTFTILVGAQDEEGNHVLKASNSDYYVTIASYSVDTLINRGRDDYARIPEGTEEEGSGTLKLPGVSSSGR